MEIYGLGRGLRDGDLQAERGLRDGDLRAGQGLCDGDLRAGQGLCDGDLRDEGDRCERQGRRDKGDYDVGRDSMMCNAMMRQHWRCCS